MSILKKVLGNGPVPYGVAYFVSVIVMLFLSMGAERLYPHSITWQEPSLEYLVSSEFAVRSIFALLIIMIMTTMLIKLALLDKRNGKDWLKVPDELNDWEE